MRLLMLDAEYFRSEITVKGRSPLAEEVTENNKILEEQEVLIILILVEKEDEPQIPQIVDQTTKEITDLTGKQKINKVILIPFAHLFGTPADPRKALNALDNLQQKLIDKGLKVNRLPFGWFNKLEMRLKGHPLSRISRRINLP